MLHALQFGEVNRYYFSYGLDIKGTHPNDFIDYLSFMNRRNNLNQKGEYNYICLLRDKSLFEQYAKDYVPVLRSVATCENGHLSIPLTELFDKYPNLFFKPKDGICGQGAFGLEYKIKDKVFLLNDTVLDAGAIDSFICNLSGQYIIQPGIKQHDSLNSLYPQAINTLRVISFNRQASGSPEDIVILGALLRIGANGLVVDNWAKGGLVVGINGDGRLMKYGFFKPGFGTKTESHPNTGIRFEGFDVPFYFEALDLVRVLHSKMSHIYTVGWDIAITSTGPVFVEGNDDYELGFFQTCYGGLKTVFLQLFNNQ